MKKTLIMILALGGAALWPLACGKNLAPSSAGSVTATATPTGPTATATPVVWQIVGSASFSAGAANSPVIAFNNSGQPYVAYSDGANSNKATVMMYNGGGWAAVGGAGFTTGAADSVVMAFNSSGQPYVAYGDQANSDRATVR